MAFRLKRLRVGICVNGGRGFLRDIPRQSSSGTQVIGHGPRHLHNKFLILSSNALRELVGDHY